MFRCQPYLKDKYYIKEKNSRRRELHENFAYTIKKEILGPYERLNNQKVKSIKYKELYWIS